MAIDHGHGSDSLGVHAGVPFTDGGRETATLLVEKFDLDMTSWAQSRLEIPSHMTVQRRHFRQLRIEPYEAVEVPGNLMTTAGWAQLFKSIIGGSPTLFSSSVGRIGVGTGTTAATSADTALGSVSSMTGSNWILCGAAPTDSTSSTPCTSVFTASFGTSAAVGSWNEWAVDQGTASAGPTVTATAPMMNHSVPGAGVIGTKGSATWTATATLSFT
jgi:hypothetical protein